MTGLFDGMTTILADTLGSSVTYTPSGGSARSVQSILRRSPLRVTGPDGVDELVVGASWRVRADLVPEIARDDTVEDAVGTMRIVNIWPQGSSASDAHLICELEDMIP